jgi:hypothetical protein
MSSDKPVALKVSGKSTVKIGSFESNGFDNAIEADEESDLTIGKALINKYPKLKPLVAAIKKPRANNNEGWKIMIVGVLLAGLLSVVCMVLYDFYVKPTLDKTLNQQQQTAESKEIK